MNNYRIQNVYARSKYPHQDKIIQVGECYIAPAIKSEFSFESSSGDWYYVWLKRGRENPFEEGDTVIGRKISEVYFFQNRIKGCILLDPL